MRTCNLPELANGGEAFIVDHKRRAHVLVVDDDGTVLQHRRYEGNEPGAMIRMLVEAFENGEDLDADLADVTTVDML